MKDLKQAAKDYAEVTEVFNSVDSKLIEEAFLKGAEFVNTWISVKDCLPNKGRQFFNDSDTLLVKVENGKETRILTGHYDLDDKEWYIHASNYCLANVIEWRYI